MISRLKTYLAESRPPHFMGTVCSIHRSLLRGILTVQ